jgi:hypothetical protein
MTSMPTPMFAANGSRKARVVFMIFQDGWKSRYSNPRLGIAPSMDIGDHA